MSRPGRLAWLLVAFVVLAWGLPALAAPAPSKGPKIVFEQTEIVYPNAKEGQTLTAQFHFTNQGSMNLLVESVTPSCGCQVAEFDKVVKPGAKGVINLTLDTSGITGAFRKTAVVNSNDPANPFVTLIMIGETQSRVKVEKGRRLDLVGCLGQNPSVSTGLSDPEGRPTIRDHLRGVPERVYPVGRLDYDAEGALVFAPNGFTVTAAALANPPGAIVPFAAHQVAGASFARSSSRDGSVASVAISAAPSAFPSITPPRSLKTSCSRA